MLEASQPSSLDCPVNCISSRNCGSAMTNEMLLLSNMEMIQ
jgi:hypothetical protein